MPNNLAANIKHAEQSLLEELRSLSRLRRAIRAKHPALDPDRLTVGQKIADTVAFTMGS